MSDTSQGPGWWQASDGRWYPPQGSMPPPPPPYGTVNGGRRTDGGATASLIFGILGFLILPLIGAIVALVLGSSAKGRIRASNGALDGDGMATAGIILGALGLVLPVLAIAAIIAITFLGTSASTKFDTVGSSIQFLGPLLHVRP